MGGRGDAGMGRKISERKNRLFWIECEKPTLASIPNSQFPIPQLKNLVADYD
jgi:hypothetical protein